MYAKSLKHGKSINPLMAYELVCFLVISVLHHSSETWPISFEMNYGKCLFFGLRLYTPDDVVCQKVLLGYPWWSLLSYANLARQEVWKVLGHVTATAVHGSRSFSGVRLNFLKDYNQILPLREIFYRNNAKIDPAYCRRMALRLASSPLERRTHYIASWGRTLREH